MLGHCIMEQALAGCSMVVFSINYSLIFLSDGFCVCGVCVIMVLLTLVTPLPLMCVDF
jgi:hypothetical protein